ncbi:NUDIX domain-containing protein [Glycomyces luteolus]|uniref:NUDIX domain-containing protein n=1 Tax=Glycomyces luteolus TaxID=2670330 RepID=A0A9X3PF57_9ACTN|nr:NUDIX domain-containing protein [Glycomyces luteolus]MDA1362348.1 NUDIX domain-containing protein [Glycomyces luteolus]
MAIPADPVRRSARVLLVDGDGRVLLFFNHGSAARGRDYYFTVGGGVEDGESLAGAAAREVFEETGLRVAPEALGPVVCRREGRWRSNSGIRYWAEEHYFLLRVDRFEPDFRGMEEGERDEVARHAWLSPADLDAVDAIVFPIGLAGLLEQLLGGGRPGVPIELPWVDLP